MNLPINQIICGDCLEVMKDWPDNCVDLVFTSPPYNLGNVKKNSFYACSKNKEITISYDKHDDNMPNPSPFPLALAKKVVLGGSSEGKVVVDCFSGSGTTCVAAKMLGRNYIGIDISEEYCEIARQRIKAVETGVPVKEQKVGQQPLFP